MHDQLHPVLGDAVSDRFHGRRDPGGDSCDALDRFLQIIRESPPACRLD